MRFDSFTQDRRERRFGGVRHLNMKEDDLLKKIVAIIIVLIVILALCTGCSSTDGEKIITTAKIRYFDGSMDTLEISGFQNYSGIFRLELKEGTIMYVAPNNLIIIQETEERYYH